VILDVLYVFYVVSLVNARKINAIPFITVIGGMVSKF